ncbi:DoxX family membrane protein [candidate division GN15 bacterium]|nr:DoxX family membrane protein [candidate division GN15 bacterium]
MSDRVQGLSSLIGRILLVAIFLSSGFNKLFNWSQTAAYMESKGMPMVPLFLAAAMIILIVGGLSVLLGYLTRLGAAALIVFLIPTSIIFHGFWSVEAAQVQQQTIHFMKNMGLMGGLFLLIAHGPGRYSLDSRRR